MLGNLGIRGRRAVHASMHQVALSPFRTRVSATPSVRMWIRRPLATSGAVTLPCTRLVLSTRRGPSAQKRPWCKLQRLVTGQSVMCQWTNVVLLICRNAPAEDTASYRARRQRQQLLLCLRLILSTESLLLLLLLSLLLFLFLLLLLLLESLAKTR